MILNEKDYLSRVLGCWMGKNIGGTLGAPFEWRRQCNNVSFYAQKLTGEPVPNDDLDIQLLWLVMLEERGIDIDARTLSEYWCLYVTPHWAEYGTAKINMRSGLLPPISGTLENDYKNSCGSFIRAEIWACIAPGCPQLAAKYAYQDAILDHGNGEGTYAEVFIAALESAAFVISDLRKLIDIGLSYIPKDCGVAQAVATAIEAADSGKGWKEARDLILTRHRGGSVANNFLYTSPEDIEKGFQTGQRGYDVPSNIAILIYGLLHGGDDFGKAMCATVNCGEDTDCTGATAGSIWGIIHGIDGIPQKWIDPIGRKIGTMVLNLGEIYWVLPRTVDELTDRTARLAKQVLLRNRRCGVSLAADHPTSKPDPKEMAALLAPDQGAAMYAVNNANVFTFDFFTVAVDYGQSPMIRSGEPKTIRLTIRNTYKVQTNLSLQWYLPDGWQITPAPTGVFKLMSTLLGPDTFTAEFSLRAEKIDRTLNRCVVELTSEGRPMVMLVPIALLNGNLLPA